MMSDDDNGGIDPELGEQLPLFDKPVPKLGSVGPALRHDAKETSRMAAAVVMPITRRDQRRVLKYLLKAGDHGASDWAIERDTGIHPNGIRARRGELADMGLIVVDPALRRPNPGGNQCDVWVVVDPAIATKALEDGAPPGGDPDDEPA